jgi:hypothetical protein
LKLITPPVILRNPELDTCSVDSLELMQPPVVASLLLKVEPEIVIVLYSMSIVPPDGLADIALKLEFSIVTTLLEIRTAPPELVEVPDSKEQSVTVTILLVDAEMKAALVPLLSLYD